MKRIDLQIRLALLAALVVLITVLGRPRPLPSLSEVRLPPEPPKRSVALENTPQVKPAFDSVGEEEAGDEPAAAPSLDGLVEQLSRRELQLPMEAIRPRLTGCKGSEHFTSSLQVRLRISHSGSVESASVLPPYEHTAAAECVRQVSRTARFGRFRGARNQYVELTYPVLFRE